MKIIGISKSTYHCEGWLKERFGDHYAQISVDSTLKLRMAVQDVARYKKGHLPPEIVMLTKRFKMPPQGVTDFDFVMGYETDEGHQPGSLEDGHENYDPALKEYTKNFSDQWEIVKKCLGLSRQRGRHACAFAVANRPIHEFVPLTTVSDVRVTAYTAASVEAVGGLKMDFLVVNSLNDLNDTIQMAQARYGHLVDISQYKVVQHDEAMIGWSGPQFNQDGAPVTKRFSLVIDGKQVPCQRLVPISGRFYDVWDLPADQDVFADVATGKTETVFQFSTPGAVQWLEHFGKQRDDGTYAIDSIAAMATFTALDRPGPLDMFVVNPDDNSKRHNMLVEYARRARGDRPSPEVPEVFNELVPETKGILCFQEQVQKIYQETTGCSLADAEEFRSDIAKKKKAKIEKAYPVFMEGATKKLGSKESAQQVWNFIETFSKYGFNLSHAVCYSVIGYACAYFKHHFQLEWWTAVLKNAAKNEVNEKFWKHCGHLIDLPDAQYSGTNFEIQGTRIRAPLSLLQGVGATAHAQLTKYAPYVNIEDFCQKIYQHRKANQFLVKRVPQEDGKSKWVKLERAEADHYKAMDPKDWGDDVKYRLGHNALNRKVVYTLILSDAMESLFPKTEDRTVLDNLSDFERALADAGYVPQYTKTGKLKARPKIPTVDPKYINLTAVARYQRKKAILPAYSQDLVKLFHETKVEHVGQHGDGWFYGWHPPDDDRRHPIGFATCKEIEKIDRDGLDDGQRVTVAVAAYVESSRHFSYGDERREACELVLDVEGGRFKLVKWGGRNITVPEIFQGPENALKGAVVVVVLTKFKSDRPFAIEDLVIVEPPIDHEEDNTDGEDE